MQEVINASFGELLPLINVGTSSTQVTFDKSGIAMRDVVMVNLGPDVVIVTTTPTGAVVPSSDSVDNCGIIGPGGVITYRKGINNKSLFLICPTTPSEVWAHATSGQ